MTERLYYTDAYRTAFRSRVEARSNDGLRVYLVESAFYPTSGGQPHDTGTLDGLAVTDVVDEGDRVMHVLASPLAPHVEFVDGVVDWARRFDLMQQHTGQHLLSAMFEDRHGWPTVSVHFGAESSTLDVTAREFEPEMLAEAERVANALVVENREISVAFEDAVLATGLRKASDRDGTLRIVSIAELDRSACGGTHVRRTGEIGGILLRRAERSKGQVRIEFVCGQRAVTTARHDAMLLTRAAAVFTASPDDVPRLVEAQHQQLRDGEREARRLRTELAGHEARAYWDDAAVGIDGIRRIRIAYDHGPVKEREALAQAIVARGQVAVVVTSASPAGILLATSADSGIDAGQAIRGAVAPVGGRGGGSPRLAQASVPDASVLPTVRATLGFGD
jgi:alanyl-tRNA synthetase